MINQSFKVKDFKNGETYGFHLISKNTWILKRWGYELKMTQKEVESNYKYFTTLWVDYDVTLLEKGNTVEAV